MSTLHAELVKRALMDGARGTPAAALYSHVHAPRKEIGLALESLVIARRLTLRGGYYYAVPTRVTPAPAVHQEKPVAHPTPVAAPDKPAAKKQCQKCEHDLDLKCFSIDRSTRDGKSRWCIECQAKHRRDRLTAKNSAKAPPAPDASTAPPKSQPVAAPNTEAPALVSIGSIVIQIPGASPALVTIKQAGELYSQLQAVLARVG